MTRGLKTFAVLALALGAALAAFFFYRHHRASAEVPKPAAQPAGKGGPQAPIEADAYAVKATRVQVTVPATGTIVANESVSVVSELPRRLVKIYVEEGAQVKKGDLLFKLDDADLSAQLARLRVRRTHLAGIEARQKKLLEDGLVSQQDFDQSNAEVRLTEAEIGVLAVTASKTQIRAPFAGRVGLRRASEGAWVTPDRPITTLQDTSRVKIDFNLPERYGPSLKSGQKVSFQVAGRDARYEAAVIAIEPEIDAISRSLVVRAVAENPRGELVPGSFASIEVPLEDIEGGIMIPSQAVIPSLGGHGVFVDRGGKAQLQDIEIGIRTDTKVQVLRGLEIGDTVLTSNLLRVRPGSPLKVKPAADDKLCSTSPKPPAGPDGQVPPPPAASQ